MRRVKSPTAELLDLRDRSTEAVQRALRRIAIALIRRDSEDLDRAQRKLADIVAGAQGLADLLGRRRLLLERDHALSRAKGARIGYLRPVLRTVSSETALTDPDLSFKQAVEDLIKREPRLASAADEVARIYTREHGFTAIRATRVTVLERIQKLMRRNIEEGKLRDATVQQIVEASREQLQPFTQSYAEIVFDNNLATAYAAGRERQVADPDVADVIAGFRYVAVGDADTRDGTQPPLYENHLALDGLIASVDAPEWDRYSPPCGHRCRCSREMVDRFEAEDAGWLEDGRLRTIYPPSFSFAKVHPGFGHRSSTLIYQGAA